MEQKKPFRVLLADDHGVVREGVAAYFQTLPELEVVALCSDGSTAARLILELRPDFAVLDLNMPNLSGLEVIRKVRNAGSQTKIIVLSIDRNPGTVQELFRSGANGYVLKDGPLRHILDAIHYVADGGKYTTPLLQGVAGAESAANSDPVASLSNREKQVFAMLVDGKRPRDIARALYLSPKTVDTYRAAIMRKLEVDGIAGLVKYAIQRNLGGKS